MSLRQTLNDEIRSHGYLSLERVHQIARETNAKLSNAERRLRPSESPSIEAVRSHRGHVVGYRWIGETVIADPEMIKKYPDLFREVTKTFDTQQTLL